MFDKLESLRSLESLSKVKQREVYCPTANIRAITTPLIASDDLMLRTTISAVDTYDLELTKLLFKHTLFTTMLANSIPMDLETFMNSLSYLDRQILLWGVFDGSYETLGKQTIKCPNCSKTWEDDITSKQILHEDSILPWDNELPFNEYMHPIEHVVGLENFHKIVFYTSIPTIRQHLSVLSLIPGQKLRDNFDKFGSILSKVEELTSVTRKIELYKLDQDIQPSAIWESTKDIHMVISRYILLDMVESILEEYNSKFVKYVPKFRKPYICSECGNNFDYKVDMEVGLFRRFLRG